MTVYKELTELHQTMCHKFYETAKNLGVYTSECDEIMNDIKALESIVEKYLGAEMDDYQFVKD